MLEWKPRFVAVLVVLALVLTVASGFAEWVFDNWEW